MDILDYSLPATLEEAYTLLHSDKKASIIGGGLFLRMRKDKMPLLIDLKKINLDYITEEKDYFLIGSMTTLRDIEISDLPDGIKESVKQIAGVGVRNIATIGGSVYGRYPFSDIDTALLANNAELEFFNNKTVLLEDYFKNGLDKKDILVSIKVNKTTSYTKFFKPVYTDFSIVNISVCKNRVAVGARPGKAVCIENVDFNKSSKDILEEIKFTSDFKGSGEYRRAVAESLLDDIKKEMEV